MKWKLVKMKEDHAVLVLISTQTNEKSLHVHKI